MWSISLNRPLGGASARRITLFVSVALMALLVIPAFHATPTAAQAAPDKNLMVTWSEEKLLYNGITLVKSTTPPASNPFIPSLSNTPCEESKDIYYSAIGTADSHPGDALIAVICLDKSFNNDKSLATDATFLLYRTPQNGRGLTEIKVTEFTKGDLYEVTIAPEGVDGLGNPTDDTELLTTCDSANTRGLGWIICPVTNWLSDSMDHLYKALSSFLIVSPLLTDKDNVMYYIWDLMRNLANILFIAGFLIIIYSQITNIGISGYGIKRLLPRLVIAAVLVNVSYWIAAAAIDASNLLGYSLNKAFETIQNEIPKSAGQTYNFGEMTWKSLAGVLLSGSAASFVAITGIAGIVASAGGSIWFLLVALAGVILSGLVAILVLAARQALVTILVIVSPLAFVAYLLPSTEKYFDKWKDLFMTMLLVYPIFSVVFGGAQLAGIAIMQNARPDNPNFFNLIILGMVVQVAPVIITPLLIKLSGSLLGKVAGMANNPNRGLIDQTRKFAQGKSDMRKKSQIGETRDGKFVHNNPLALAARWNSNREIDKARKLKAYDTGVEAAYELSSSAHSTHQQSTVNEMLKSQGESGGKAAVAREIANREALRRLYYQQYISKSEAEFAESQNKTNLEEVKARPTTATASLQDLANRIHDVSVEAQDETQRQTSITQEYDSQYWKGLANDTTRQAHAGAAGIAEQGEARIANLARQKQNEERERLIGAGLATINQLELTNDDRMNIIFGNQPTSPRASSLRADFHNDLENQSASIRSAFENMPQFMKHQLIENLDMTSSANGNIAAETKRSEAVSQLKKNKPIWVSSTILNQMEEGTLDTAYRGVAGTERMIKEEVVDKRGASAQTFASADRDDLKRVVSWINNNKAYLNANPNLKKHIQQELIKVYKLDEYSGALDKRINELDAMWAAVELKPDKSRYGIKDGEITGL